MTREEASIIIGNIPINGDGCYTISEYQQAKAKAIEALERGNVLDKIRAEIEQEYNCLSVTRADETLELGECLGLKMALKIIDKYKAESEKE